MIDRMSPLCRMERRHRAQQSTSVLLDGPGRMSGALTATKLWMRRVMNTKAEI